MEFNKYIFIALALFLVLPLADAQIGTTGPQWASQGQDFGEFNGLSSLTTISSNSILQSLNDTQSWSFWVKSAEANQGVNKGIIATRNVGAFIVASTGSSVNELKFRINDGTNNVEVLETISNIIIYNHVVLVIDGFNSTGMKIYINNVLERTIDISIITDLQNTNDMIFGDQSGDFFSGSLDEVLIYNQSLTQAEITTLFNQYTLTSTGVDRTGTPSTTGLILNINFDNSSVSDQSGNGNNGNNTDVGFGIVFNDLKILVTGIDYTISGTLFSIINADYFWNQITLDYEYNGNPICPLLDTTTLKNGFSTFALGIITFLGIIGLLIGTIWLASYLRELFNKEDGISSFAGN